MITALCAELQLRKATFEHHTIHHIYFGGGTPSLCTTKEIDQILTTIYTLFKVSDTPEITLEANPDDLTEEKIIALSKSKINRLSIGIQSFFERDLQLMNRAHNAFEAKQSIILAQQYFKNISIDLIYGIPNLTHAEWQQNLQQVLDFDIPHISCYALTVEKNTALEHLINKGIINNVNDAKALAQYQILVTTLEKAGYINYEFSNFGKAGFFSGNNTAYWEGKPYLGIGPSAHSFDGKERSWNVSNNNLYLKNMLQGKRLFEKEHLSVTDKYNEYIMTGLRTMWGVSLKKIEVNFGPSYAIYFKKMSQKFIADSLMHTKEAHYFLTPKGKFLGDGIASDLFYIS